MFEIKLIEANNAHKQLKNIEFISEWHALSKHSDKITVHQEPAFAINWYHNYAADFEPVLVLAYTANNELVGVMPLAHVKSRNILTHAGEGQAEYKGWLCIKEIDQEFPIEALIILKKAFNLKKWNWGWLSPRSKTEWMSSEKLKKEGIYLTFKTQDSPLLDVSDDDKLNKLNKSRSTKTKINRYIKRGNFHLERITNKDAAIKVFNILEKQCDFRQMAANHSTPFLSDRNKKNFYIDKLNSPENSHFTILWSNNKPVAYNFGDCGKGSVEVGLMSYDPLEGKNSPGKILLIKLAELLKEEGFQYLDLTPGNDSYKEGFANCYQKLYHLTFHFSKKDKLVADFKGNLIKKIKKISEYANIDIKNIYPNIKSIPTKTINLLKSIKKKEVYSYHKIDTDTLIKKTSINNKNEIEINSYWDLLKYNKTRTYHTKDEVISNALRRFSFEDTLFSILKDDELIHFGWMTKNLKNQNLTEIDSYFKFPENSVVCYDFFTKGDLSNTNFIDNTLHAMGQECKNNGISEIFIGAFNNNRQKINLIKNIGFIPYQQMERSTLFWKEKIKTTTL